MNIIKTAIRLALCITIFPAFGGWLTNRRNPNFPLVSPMDIYLNVSDFIYAFLHRTPKDSVIHRNKQGDIDGHFYQHPQHEDDDHDR